MPRCSAASGCPGGSHEAAGPAPHIPFLRAPCSTMTLREDGVLSLTSLPSVGDVEVSGKRVLVRADLNVPLADGAVADAARIERFLPTVQDLLDRGAAVVVMTHLGRPGGQRDLETSLAPVAEVMRAALQKVPVRFVPDCIGGAAEAVPGEVVLLENLRFHPGEERDDPAFAEKLAVQGDLFVNDAFSCSHRAHASLHAITRLLPSYAGPGLLAEFEALQSTLAGFHRPLVAIVGGAKIGEAKIGEAKIGEATFEGIVNIEGKIRVLRRLAERADTLIIGGGMANTFLAALGHSVGYSLCEPHSFDVAREVLNAAEDCGCEILLPEDVVVAERFLPHAPFRVLPVGEVPEDSMILDVGPRTVERISERLMEAESLLWNGPLGAFETPPFEKGTFAVAERAAELCRAGRLAVIGGGGDTVAAFRASGTVDDFTYVSMAGGAFLAWLGGQELPGVEALRASGV